jgi:hypothetical protein
VQSRTGIDCEFVISYGSFMAGHQTWERIKPNIPEVSSSNAEIPASNSTPFCFDVKCQS